MIESDRSAMRPRGDGSNRSVAQQVGILTNSYSYE